MSGMTPMGFGMTPDQDSSFSNALPPEYQSALMQQQYKLMLAQQLMQQGAAASNQPTQMAGQIAIRQSPLQAVSSLANTFLGMKERVSAMQGMQQVQQGYQQGLQSELGKVLSIKDPQQQMNAALTSNYPYVRSLGQRLQAQLFTAGQNDAERRSALTGSVVSALGRNGINGMNAAIDLASGGGLGGVPVPPQAAGAPPATTDPTTPPPANATAPATPLPVSPGGPVIPHLPPPAPPRIEIQQVDLGNGQRVPVVVATNTDDKGAQSAHVTMPSTFVNLPGKEGEIALDAQKSELQKWQEDAGAARDNLAMVQHAVAALQQGAKAGGMQDKKQLLGGVLQALGGNPANYSSTQELQQALSESMLNKIHSVFQRASGFDLQFSRENMANIASDPVALSNFLSQVAGQGYKTLADYHSFVNDAKQNATNPLARSIYSNALTGYDIPTKLPGDTPFQLNTVQEFARRGGDPNFFGINGKPLGQTDDGTVTTPELNMVPRAVAATNTPKVEAPLTFTSEKAALDAVRAGHIRNGDTVLINGKKLVWQE